MPSSPTPNALRLAADLLETGKTVAWVYVTHPHLDHFNGAALIRHVFPTARFYAQPGMIAEFRRMVASRQESLGAGVPGGPANLPTVAPDFFEPLAGQHLSVDGEAVEILTGFGDHPESSAVWVPAAKTVITGDLVFANTHASTGDHRNIAGWIGFLRQIQSLNPASVVVGHGAPEARHDGSVIAEQIRWLEDFQRAIDEQDTLEHVQAVMVQRYPNYANAFIFPFSYQVMSH
jgi:glyoxylase-like metal-dependent hydrolase (beta-lactamase superfamily II)